MKKIGAAPQKHNHAGRAAKQAFKFAWPKV